MRWSDYDGWSIRVVQQKTGAPLVIPAHQTLRAELNRWKAEGATSVFILTEQSGGRWTPNHLNHVMAKAIAQLGMRRGLNLHGLRKLAAVSLAEAGCSAHEIAAVTGHRTLAMVQLYTASAEQERLAGAAILRLERKK